MRVFIAVTSLHQSYGGPAISVARLAAALARRGVHVGLWAADAFPAALDAGEQPDRLSMLSGPIGAALKAFEPMDVIHDNGLWLAHNHALSRYAQRRSLPRVVSARGMLEPWAMGHKKLKKRVAWALYQRRDLNCAACLHATSEPEASNLMRLGFDVPIAMVPNGVDPVDAALVEAAWIRKRTINAETRTALFLGRLHPVKGLGMLIEAWARIRPTNWRLVIAGPDEANHQAELERAVKATNLGDIVSFPGPLGGTEKAAAFLAADLFVLPSFRESFGMAVAEALAHGLPVVTTKGAPWAELHSSGSGWWTDISVDGIASALLDATSCRSETLCEMGKKGKKMVESAFNWDRAADELSKIYDTL